MALLATLPAYSATPSENWAVVQQEDLPAWEARAAAATARAEAGERWRNQGGARLEAFPFLRTTGVPGRPSVLRGKLAALDEAAVDRAAELAATLPDLSEDQRAKLAEARSQALAAEERADAHKRFLWVTVLARLTAYPSLGEEALAEERASWLQTIEEASNVARDAPEHLTAVRAAARAHESLAELDALVDELRTSALPDGSVPDASPLIARVRAGDEDAVPLLELLTPFLPAGRAAAAGDALEAWWADVAFPRALAKLEEPGERPEDLPAALARATERLQDLEAGSPAEVPKRATLQAELEALRAFEAEPPVQDAGNEAAKALTEAQRAKQEADEALAEAQTDREKRRADALATYAHAQEFSATLWQRAQGRSEAATEVRTTHLEPLQEITRKVELVETLSSLDPSRPKPDELFSEVRAHLTALAKSPAARGTVYREAESTAAEVQRSVARDRERIESAKALLPRMPEEQRDDFQRSLAGWSTVLDGEARASEELLLAATNERDAAQEALQLARSHRRTLASYATREALSRDAGHFSSDLRTEIETFVPTLLFMLRDRAFELFAIPGQLMDVRVLRTVVIGSFWTLAIVLGWWWIRAQAATWALAAASRVREYRSELRPADVLALKEPTARFLRNLTDLALGRMLVWSLGDSLPEVGLLLLVYLQVALYRALIAFFDLVVVRSEEVRPGLLMLRPEAYVLARTTVQAVLGFFIARRFVDYMFWDVLGLDAASSLFAFVFGIAFWGLVAWVLWRWEPTMHQRIRQHQSENRIVAWLARDGTHPVLRIPRAIGMLVFFGLARAVDITFLLARDGTSLAWMFNAVNRYRLAETDEDEAEQLALPDEVCEALSADPPERHPIVERAELMPPIEAELNRWKRQARRGMVAIIGHRGSGKRTSCDQVIELLKKEGLPPTRGRFDRSTITEGEVVNWVANLLGLEECVGSDELVAAIEQRERGSFVIEGAHRVFSRKVGGFEGLATLLYVMNATSDKHFWVVSVHAPSWDYWAAQGSLVDTGVFRTVVRLAPMNSSQLKDLTIARTSMAGWTVDFSGLSRPNPLSSDATLEHERAVSVFYRLLAEACDGNPTVAMEMWPKLLEPTDVEKQARVKMGASLSMDVELGLNDAALFLLAALRLQDELPLAELVEVTNLPLHTVRATVRDMLGRGLCALDGDQIHIPDGKLPLVARTLRRRHFLHLGV